MTPRVSPGAEGNPLLADLSAERKALLLAALEYGVSPLVAREAVFSVALDRDETVSLEER